MHDTDVIARLYSHESRVATQAIEDDERGRRLDPPPLPKCYRSSGETAESPDNDRISPGPAHSQLPCLELRFSQGPKSQRGFVFGCDRECDVVLPGIPGVSLHHFSLGFDDAHRPVVRDLGSSWGTSVTYDGKGGGWRHNFTWILGGKEIPEKSECIVIQVSESLQFQIVLPHHDITSPTYIGHVLRFREGTSSTENLFDRLDIQSQADTRMPSVSRSPCKAPILIKQFLGSGTGSMATRCWDVSTGEDYVVKQPSVQALRSIVCTDGWREEARLLRQVEHENIVRFYDAEIGLVPRILLEYVPGGSIRQQQSSQALVPAERAQVLRQCLSALTYLHDFDPPIIHRDISATNILVQDRADGRITVKLADFRAARQTFVHETLVGNRLYMAPELSSAPSRKSRRPSGALGEACTPAVDIWSLGVVMFDLLCSWRLPAIIPPEAHEPASWCAEVVRYLNMRFQERPDDTKQLLSSQMVVMEPNERGSAAECYGRAQWLAIQEDDDTPITTPTPTQTSHNAQIARLRGPNPDGPASRKRSRDGSAEDGAPPRSPKYHGQSRNTSDKDDPAFVRDEDWFSSGWSEETDPRSPILVRPLDSPAPWRDPAQPMSLSSVLAGHLGLNAAFWAGPISSFSSVAMSRTSRRGRTLRRTRREPIVEEELPLIGEDEEP